ncbi:MAG TPA: Asd/ArgC dimerization domain-containing protein [Terriglobales bacterium]|nr:Asd/ArgC dimerization domain-containing protein [Terriglobales bacterium]
MSPEFKPAAPALRSESERGAGNYRVAIVGAATLKGKELVDVLNDRKFPRRDLKLLDDDESLGQLEAVGDEVSFVQAVRPEHFQDVDFAFFASEEKFTKTHWHMAQKSGAAIVDLSFALENEPSASLRSTWVERQLGQAPSPELQPAPVVVAHPAAVVMALVALRAQKSGKVARMATTLYQPASEYGRRGMDELHEQTVNLLSFHELPKEVFDAQVAFNLLTRYGEKSVPVLESVERRVLDHYRRTTAGQATVPSLLVVQAPVFHGYAFSIYVEMQDTVSVGDLAQALAGEHVTVTRGADESPSNVNAAGQSDILVAVRRDATQENGFWIWAAVDNLRIAASTAVECAEAMAASRPRGKIQ